MHLVRGKWAEDQAFEWVRARIAPPLGGLILGRNVRYRFGELDFVFEEGSSSASILVFLEVRSRAPRFEKEGASVLRFFSSSKIEKLKRAGRAFLSGYRGSAQGVRFDLLILEMRAKEVVFTHLPNAW